LHPEREVKRKQACRYNFSGVSKKEIRMGNVNELFGRSINGTVIIVAVTGMLLWAAADVFAQGHGPCAEDAAKYCKDVQPGQGRMAQCLKEHGNELSAACKEHIAQMKQRGRGAPRPARTMS
ncbi:MAG TPA: cysteine rich repeat-containing protein, partial [Nitrospirota bacterium]